MAVGGLAAILLAASAAQFARPHAIRLARGVAQIDLIIAAALLWTLDHDFHRHVFWVAVMALAEVAAVLGRRWMLPALAVILSSYLLLEAARPGRDVLMASARVGVATVFTVVAYVVLRRLGGRDERLRRVQADVVEARRAADEIRASEQRHRAMVEEVPVVSYRVDAVTRRLDYVSPQLEAVFGHAVERWLEAGLWQEWVHPDDRVRVAGAWSARAGDPSPSTLEYRLITGQHRIVWVVDRDQAVCDDAGRVVARHGVLVDITERRAAEAATRRSEQNFRLLAEHAPIGIFRVDPAGRHRYANDCACAIAGTSTEQLRQQGWFPSIHDDDRVRVLAAWERAGSGIEPIEMAYRFQRPDGEVRWVETLAVPLLDGDGSLIGYQGTISDITERHAAEEALRASEQRYRLLADRAPVGIFEVDPTRGARYANPRNLEIAGMSEERFRQDGLLPHIHPDDRGAVLGEWTRTADSDEGFDLQCRLMHPDGGLRWVRLNAAGLPDQGGYLGVMIDVTEEHRAGEALRSSEQRLRDVFDTVDLLATITTVDGKIAYINEALAASVGRTAEELVGHDWIETLSADADASVVEYFYSELRAGRIVRHDENSIETDDGRVRLIAWSNTILCNSDGSVFGAASIGEDVTEQRAAAAALRDSEERFRTLSELAPVGIFRTDSVGGLVYVNEHWSQITGLPLEQAAGREWTIALHPDDLTGVSAEWTRAAAAGERFSMERRFQHADGSEVWVHVTAVALRDRSGAIEGYLGTTVDVTLGWPERGRSSSPSGGCGR